ALPAAEGLSLRLVRPPGVEVEDSARVTAALAVTTSVGDRIYFADGEALHAIRPRGVEAVARIGVGDPVVAAVATPSGDRVIVVAEGAERLSIIDRFEGKVADRIDLPGAARDVRMDPLGRVVLARAATGDSAWVVSLANGAVVGAVATGWRADLPFVGADDRIALLRGGDVVFVSLESLAEAGRVARGGADYWFPMRWNGFRPRAAGLDQPVRFRAGTMRSDSMADSAVMLGVPSDSASPPPDTASGTLAVPAARITESRPASRFYVVLGSATSAAEARDSAARVSVAGARGRVLSARSAGGPVHLIVLGPYGSRAAADDVRRVIGPRAWVTEERP
ncbi:MAG: SPOR domain-containing protein, partial [Gemmatimonadaceae bacterium]|nr:SPOR domain-containing protein [Gemmatimonadaceae bacterium]